MARIDEVRIMTKVARMDHEQGLRQTDVMEKLDLSQSTISRLLKRAETEQIVRISVSMPMGVFCDLEEALQTRFGLRQAVVIDSVNDDEAIARDVGKAAAFYLESTLKQGEVIGISSWSSTLLHTVNAMQDIKGAPVRTPLDGRVISMTHQQLQHVRRSVGVAGGRRKLAAIRGALKGRWINTLITDRLTAQELLKGAD
jgi:DNA-binding transcriptional regulator LsrR (DeoR family)